MVAVEGYRPFRKDRQRGGVALYMREQLESMELCLGMDEEPAECLWVWIKGRTGQSDIIAGVCSRPPDQDEALYRQVGVASYSQALVIMGDFKHPNICWWDNTAGHKQSRRFLESIDSSLFLQGIEEPLKKAGLPAPTYQQRGACWGCEG